MPRFRSHAVAVAALTLFAASPLFAADAEEALVAVFRDGAPAKAMPSSENATPILDDGEFVLALAGKSGIRQLRDAGWRVDVLDADPRSKDDYYVLHRVSDAVLPHLPLGVDGLLRAGETFVFRASDD